MIKKISKKVGKLTSLVLAILILSLTVNITPHSKVIKLNKENLTQIKALEVISGYTQVAAGWGYSMALDKNGNLWTWGSNMFGKLGNGTNEDSNIPIQVTNSLGTKFIQIAAGFHHSLALDEEGNLWTWGSNSSGQLGDGTNKNSNVPIKITNSKGTKFVYITASSDHTLAIDENGSIWAWGCNDGGQLGNGTMQESHIPVQLITSTQFTQVSTSYLHSLAIDKDGNLWAWGNNGYGKFGNGTKNDSMTPIKINTGIEFKQVSAGHTYSLGIDKQGNLWGWGSSDSGAEESTKPLQIEKANKFIKISAGIHTNNIAIDENSNLWTWIKTQFTQVKPGTEFIDIAAGMDHKMAIDKDGNLWTWGNNSNGQLGNGTNDASNEPIRVNKYIVTLDNQNPTTTGTQIIEVAVGEEMPNITIPIKDGYIFAGYYTQPNGEGTQYYTATGEGSKKWDITKDTTLYAKWIPNVYDITIRKYETDTQIGLPNAIIEVYDSNGNVKLDIDGNPVRLTTNENGIATFKASPGKYYYKEVVAPNGYELNDTMYSFTVSKDGTILFENGTNGIIYNNKKQTGGNEGGNQDGSGGGNEDGSGGGNQGGNGDGNEGGSGGGNQGGNGDGSGGGNEDGSGGGNQGGNGDGNEGGSGGGNQGGNGDGNGGGNQDGNGDGNQDGNGDGSQGGNGDGKTDETQTGTRLPQTGENKNIIIAIITIAIIGAYFGIKGIKIKI